MCITEYKYSGTPVLNPRRACAARVTVVGSVYVHVCLFKSHLTSGMSVCPENTQQATEVKKYVGFSLKLVCCRATLLPAL